MAGSTLGLLSWLLVGLFGAMGLALLAWAIVGDRARGRRRCGRCWYDMGGVEGLTCPECGRTAKAESGLRRTRRRWGMAALALVVLAVGSAPIAAPWVASGGWVPWTPTWALRLAAPLLDEASDAYMGKIAARAPELSAWERLLVARFVQRELVRETEALRTTDAAVVAFSKAQASYVSKVGAEGRLFNREMAAVLGEFERLREAGQPTRGRADWIFVCGWVGPAAAEHAPALLRIAEDVQATRETRYRAVHAMGEIGRAAEDQLLALLDAPLDALCQRALLETVGRLRLVESEELAAIFLRSTLHDETENVWLVIHVLVRLLDEDAFGYDPYIVGAVRELAAAHPRADVRELATWQLQHGKAAPPGTYRYPMEHAHMLYILTAPHPEVAPPAQGWGLVLVLPGGDGSDTFQPLVTNLARKALPQGYLVAQLVAPDWPGDANRVWPTKSALPAGAEFSTEAFVAEVVRHAADRYPLNEQLIFGLGWGSGAEAVAAAAAAEGSPLRGAVLVVDAFELNGPAPAAALHAKPFFVAPGPGEGSTGAAEAARDWLTGAGARIRSVGGASPGDWEGVLREAAADGVGWLEEQAGGR